MDLSELETTLGHHFQDPALAWEALTHRTWGEEQRAQGHDSAGPDQQRLEFLGDAFLGYIVAELLYGRFADATEGELTARRRSLTSGAALQSIGERLGVVSFLRLGRGEQGNIHANKRVLEDTAEALIGAVLLDGGPTAARAVVEALVDVDASDPENTSPLARLNRQWQQRYNANPPKPTWDPERPDHPERWRGTLTPPDGPCFHGSGSTQGEARQVIAEAILAHWNASR